MKALLRVHQGIIEELENRLIEQLDHAHFSTDTSAGKWSEKVVIGHLIDSAIHNHRRFMLAPDQKNLLFDGYNQDKWVTRNGYHTRPIEELGRLLVGANRHFYNLVSHMDFQFLTQKTDNHNFDKICMYKMEEGDPSSLSYLFWDYLYHLEHHLHQVFPDYKNKVKSKTAYHCI